MKTFDIMAEDTARGCLLIDPLNIDTERFDATLPTLRCTPPALANADELTPRLIALAALSPQQQDSARRMIADASRDIGAPLLCAWLDSALPADALARHIGRLLVGPGAGGGQVLWRYYDPRVFALALRVLSAEQRRILLGPVRAWRFPWCGRWWCVDGPGQVTLPLETGMAAWPTPAQWPRLAESALLARVMHAFQLTRPPFSDASCLRYQDEIGLSLAHARHELGLSDHDDLSQYALASARYGDRFRRHPALAAAWPALARGDIGWSALRDMLGDDDYRALENQTTGSAA